MAGSNGGKIVVRLAVHGSLPAPAVAYCADGSVLLLQLSESLGDSSILGVGLGWEAREVLSHELLALLGTVKHLGRGVRALEEVGHGDTETASRQNVSSLEDLGGEAKDIVDHEDGLLCVLGPYDVGLEAGNLRVGALGGVVGRDGGTRAAG